MTTFYVLGKVDIFLNEGGEKFLEALLGWTLPVPCWRDGFYPDMPKPFFSIMRVVHDIDQVQLHTAQESLQTLCQLMQDLYIS